MLGLGYNAVSYVLRHGSAYDKLYLAKALKRNPDPRLMEELLAAQNAEWGLAARDR